MESIRTVSEACNSPMQLRGGDNGQKTWEWGCIREGGSCEVVLSSSSVTAAALTEVFTALWHDAAVRAIHTGLSPLLSLL